MRVTNGSMVTNFLRDLNKNLKDLSKLEEKLSSGRMLNRPSDDPVGVFRALRLRSGLGEITQHLKNTDDAHTWLDATDSALGEMGDVLQRVRELAVSGSTGTLQEIEREAIAKEIDQLRDQLGQIGNTNLGGKYIFAGTKTNVPPYQAGVWGGNDEAINFEIGVGQSIAVNINGQQLFTTGGANGIMGTLQKLSNDLRAGNFSEISATDLDQLDEIMDNVLLFRGEVGARSNRIDFTRSRLQDVEHGLTTLLSETEDTDIAKIVMELKTKENVYQAALATGAKIIQPTLIDFIR